MNVLFIPDSYLFLTRMKLIAGNCDAKSNLSKSDCKINKALLLLREMGVVFKKLA